MKILFVYNANSGKLNALFDIAHKVMSPSTYACDLCTLTHGNFQEKQAWREFKATFPHPLSFLHKDEFEAQFKQHFDYPVILDISDSPQVLLDKSQLAQLQDVEALITALQKLLK